jgi:Phage Tail Collar Domain
MLRVTIVLPVSKRAYRINGYYLGMAFKSKLARSDMWCCEQTMPVPLIPSCILLSQIPQPICEVPQNQCSPYRAPPVYGPAVNPCNSPPYIIQTYTPNLYPPTGIIVFLTSDVIPDGYLLCNGEAISRIDYFVLFQATGTYYGPGDGQTTFNLPNIPAQAGQPGKYIIKA